jgi:CRP/FNR family transcriptional regulator, cyclic AMP receptor protein
MNFSTVSVHQQHLSASHFHFGDISDVAKCPDHLLQSIAELGEVRTFPAKTIIINEGDLSDSLIIILSGRVKVFSTGKSGKELVFNEHGPGEFIGEMSLDGGPRSASAITLERTRCSVVFGGELRNFISHHPDFATHLIHNLIRRARTVSDNLKSFALLDVYGRIARLLQDLAEEDGNQLKIRQKLRHQDIADRVGSSREMVTRILNDLISGGYLSVDGKIITLHKRLPPAW